MDIEGWWVIAESREVGRAPRSVTRMGERIVLWRDARPTSRDSAITHQPSMSIQD